ncbi:MAG: thioredoxin family protein [Sulfuricella sp.]
MKNIKVLGTGCANCNATMKLIEETAKAKGVEIQLEKVEDMAAILGYGVMSTPGVVIDGKVVHAGGMPGKGVVEGWLDSAESCCGCCGRE